MQAGAVGPPEELSRALLEALDDAVLFTLPQLDGAGEVVDALCVRSNPAAAAGVLGEDPVGQRLADVVGETEPPWLAAWQRVARTGRSERLVQRAAPAHAPGGRWHDLFLCRLGPPDDPLVAAVVRDATAAVRRQADLQEVQDTFRAMADSVPVTLWVTDADGRCTYVNHACLEAFGTSERTMLGTSWREILHPDDVEAYTAEFDAALRERRGFRQECRVRRTDGEVRWIETIAAARWSADGQFLGHSGSNPDITDRKRDEQRAAFLAAVGDDLAATTDPAQVLPRVAERICAHLDLARLTASRVDEVEDSLVVEHELCGPAAEPTRSRRSLSDVVPADARTQLAAGGVVATAATTPARLLAPLAVHGRWEYLLELVRSGPQPWAEEEVALVGDLLPRLHLHLARAQQAAQDAARYERARSAVAELQEALLPPGLPVLPSLDVAARYVVADAEQAAGGDWFDALVLPGGRTALVVGDVVGHGVAAAAVMSQLRAVLRQRLVSGVDLAAALSDLDAVADDVPGAFAATACVAVVEPDGRLRYATRGHPAPVLGRRDGRARQLPGGPGGPLGVDGPTGVREEALDPGDLVVLFSDGLVEHRGLRTQREGVEALVAAVGRCARAVDLDTRSPAARLCELSVAQLPAGGTRDDVTVLAAVHRAGVPGLQLAAPAVPQALARARRAVRAWAAGLGVEERTADQLELVVGEAVTNCVEHAYPAGAAGLVRVSAELAEDGRAALRVADEGRWRQPDDGPGDRGRGLRLLAALGEDLHVDGGEHGTVVTLRCALRRPVAFGVPDRLTAPAPPSPATADAAAPFDLRVDVTAGSPALVRVRGDVDLTTAPQLSDALGRATRGGRVAVEVDLTGVTHLASAGVRALFTARRAMASPGALVLRALQDSAAGQVLDLVGLERGAPGGSGRAQPARVPQ